MSITQVLSAAVFLALAAAAAAQDSVTRGSQGMSTDSQASLAASGYVVAGSAQLIQAGSQLVVSGIEATGESVVIVMKGASEAVTVSVRTSAQVAREASVAVGTGVRVVAESLGHALYVGARMIAFIPNEIGRALIHHSRHGVPPTR